MPQPIAHRVAIRAMQLAIVAAGIFVIMMLFSRQAHASTLDTRSPLGSAPSSALSSVGSAVNAVAKPVTSATSMLRLSSTGFFISRNYSPNRSIPPPTAAPSFMVKAFRSLVIS